MSKRYTVERITDIFDIPEERFEDFLVDFKSYYQMGFPMANLLKEAAKIGGIEAEVLPIRMTWIDDGKHDVTVKIGVEDSTCGTSKRANTQPLRELANHGTNTDTTMLETMISQLIDWHVGIGTDSDKRKVLLVDIMKHVTPALTTKMEQERIAENEWWIDYLEKGIANNDPHPDEDPTTTTKIFRLRIARHRERIAELQAHHNKGEKS